MVKLNRPSQMHIMFGVLGVCGCVLTSVAPVTGTSALLQSKDSAVNIFNVNSNESEIVEEFTPPSQLTRGTVINKKVAVRNTGDIPCYVRVRVLPSSDADSFQFDWNTTDWERDGTGVSSWWYYKRVLNPGQQTPNLITKATLTKDLDMTYINMDKGNAQIIVYEETAQSHGASTPKAAFGN